MTSKQDRLASRVPDVAANGIIDRRALVGEARVDGPPLVHGWFGPGLNAGAKAGGAMA